MVIGLPVFAEHFAQYKDRFAVIGGTATQLHLEKAGLQSRGTKDIDVVLTVEALDSDFVAAFWHFIELGGYEPETVMEDGSEKARYYRFVKPKRDDYPAMIELFSRAPENMPAPAEGKFRAIKGDIDLSFSAMLLDDDYYSFLMDNRKEVEGVLLANELALIALKAYAWAQLTDARAEGARDATSERIKKHMNDVLQLQQLLTVGAAVKAPDKIVRNIGRLLDAVDPEKDYEQLGIFAPIDEVVAGLRAAFEVA